MSYKATIFGLLLLPGLLWAQSRSEELRVRFAGETDPVRKAKMMPQLGNAEFREIDAAFAAGNSREALVVLREYTQQVRICEQDLDAKGINAEKHPAGFKQLQISMRQSLADLDGLLPSLPSDEQTPFVEVRKNLERLNRHLIRELFPGQPGNEPEPAEQAPEEK